MKNQVFASLKKRTDFGLILLPKKKTIFNIQIMMMIVLMIFNDVIFAVIFFKVVKGEVWHNRGWSTKMKIIFQSFIFHTLDFDLMKKLEKDWLCVFGVWNIIIFFVNNQDIMIGFENIMDQKKNFFLQSINRIFHCQD